MPSVGVFALIATARAGGGAQHAARTPEGVPCSSSPLGPWQTGQVARFPPGIARSPLRLLGMRTERAGGSLLQSPTRFACRSVELVRADLNSEHAPALGSHPRRRALDAGAGLPARAAA